MKKYLIIAGILVVGGAIGLLFPLPGSKDGKPEATPQEATDPGDEGLDRGELSALSTPMLSAHGPLGDSLTIRPNELSVGEKTAEDAAAEAEREDQEATPEELLKIVRGKPGTEEAEMAAKRLIEIYEEQNEQGLALTMRLELAGDSDRAALIEKVHARNRDLFAPGKPHPKSSFHTVTAEDRNLTRIGQHHKITPALIMKINGRKSDPIFIGQKLKVIRGPFSALVDKSSYRLTIYLEDEAIAEYPIGLGKDNSTPTGDFGVLGKLTEPTYWVEGAHYDYGDPNNPLGTRWVTFRDGGYGIHGTWEPESIGKQRSHGCVRMRNEDVEKFYDLVVKYDSKIIIRE